MKFCLKYFVILIKFQFLTIISVSAQNIKDSIIKGPLVKVHLAIQNPKGDLKKDYGTNINIGCSFGWKYKTNNTLELDYNFIHSKNVKYTGIINHLLNSQNWIINQYGEPNLYVLYHRGGQISLDLGKIFNWVGFHLKSPIGPNQNCGIHLKTGVGGMFHKIRIENENNTIPQLSKQYLKYYDRLTIGFLTKQYIGYHHMSNNKLINFSIGVEVIEGFTKGMRDYQIDLMGPYLNNRLDIYIGIRAGWIFPVFRQTPNDFYYN
tara:strand:+ start:3394 stop:4182 length:789 start_codon:yes stop_codon:yes gene_type:complete